jgi:aminoglycoside/choline kinase family phosphotransferase
MTDRADAFLAAAGWGEASRAHLAGDLSARRYERLHRPDGGTAVLMDSAGDQPVDPWLAVAAWLRDIGLHPPAVLAADAPAGLLLLEDLGDGLIGRLIAEGAAEAPLYDAALDVLLRLQSVPPPAFLPPLDEPRLIAILDLFLEYLAPDAPPEPFRAIWRDLLPLTRLGPPTFVYRDYHALNLLWRPERQGLARLGLIDFQDAFAGPAVYDLVSLLQDARRDIAPATAERVQGRWLAANPAATPDALAAALAVMGAQRALRILAIFERAATRLGKPGYRRDLSPRVQGHLRHDLAHPALQPLARWLARWTPDLVGP